MDRPLVIYHGGCPDGFAAAYALSNHFLQSEDRTCDLVPGVHGQPPPDVTGREVYLTDFSYRRPVLKEMCSKAASVVVIDHHISAEKDLKGLELEHGNLRVVFDMHKSGAVLAWEFFHDTPPPQLFLHIQDRDLWTFALDGTNDIYAALISRQLDIALMDQLCSTPGSLDLLLNEGGAINRYRRRMIDLHREKAVMANISGYQVPVVNCYEDIMSDLVGELAEGHPFAAGYQDQGELRKWSLRSRSDGMDVSRIAASYGGGGHRNAAGFSTILPDGLLYIPEGEGSEPGE